MPLITRPTYAAHTLRRLACLLAVIAVAALIGLPTFARQTPPELVKKGDALWQEQSYELALEAYRSALTGDPNLPNRAEIDYRIAVGLVRTSKWDEAIAAFDAYVLKYKDTLWEARAQVWHGRMYATIDHTGYRVGKKITRGGAVPKSVGGDAPVYINLQNEDAKEFRLSFIRARILFDRFHSAPLPAAERTDITREEIALDFDLASVLNTGYSLEGAFNGYDWTIDTNQPFDPNAPTPKKVMYLYAQIEALDATLPDANHHNTVLAEFGKAVYILQLRSYNGYYSNGGYTRVTSFRAGGSQRGGNRRAHIPRPTPMPYIRIPYLSIDPIKILQDIIYKYPNDPDADRFAYTIALWTLQKGETQGAIAKFLRFKLDYPKSRWVSDANQQLDNLLRPSVSINTTSVTRPGQRAIININSRNVRRIHFTAYRVHLEKIYGKVEYRVPTDSSIYRPAFDQFDKHFNAHNAERDYGRERIGDWNATTSDDGNHNFVNDNITTPLDTLGAYLVVADAGEHHQLKYSTLVIVSDIALVSKVDKSSLLVYGADAITGKPIEDLKLTIWQPTHRIASGYRDALYTSGVTNGEGIFTQPLPPIADFPYDFSIRRSAQVFAMAGENRYAVTNRSDFNNNDGLSGEPAVKAYITTDRPLYRPNQAVQYHVVMTDGIVGRYRRAAGKKVHLTISGPKGVFLLKEVQMGEFGSYSDSVMLPPGADLGTYAIILSNPVGENQAQSFNFGRVDFRVEEYKKPEYAVTVMPDKTEVRVGESMKATIGARYFFGAPVANAKVHYRVFRAPYIHPIPFRPRLDWYDENASSFGYMLQNGGRYSQPPDTSYWGDPNAAYREGNLITDAKGEAHISFPTDAPKPPKGYKIRSFVPADQSFTITAEVVDDSRREVTGAGSAKAAATQFRAYLKTDKQFVLPGDPLITNVRTRDAGDQPIAIKGEITYYRIIPAVPEQRAIDPKTGKSVIVVPFQPQREEKAGRTAIATDTKDEGAGVAVWHPEIPSDYRIEFSATDAWGNTIKAETGILVYGQGWDNLRDKNDARFQLVPERASYRPGDIAQVLLIAPKPDSYVLFNEQAVGGIVRHRTIFVPGRSTIIEVQLTGDYVPNAEFVATMIRDGQVQETSASVGVPAEDKILSLKITPDKAQYKPGEHAVFTVKAVGENGRPVRGEITLGVVDSSLLAIQPDLTPDIRRYFYGNRIVTAIAGADSIIYYGGITVETPDQPDYESHALVFPEGMGWLRDNIGGQNNQIPGYVNYTDPGEYYFDDFSGTPDGFARFGRSGSGGGFGGGVGGGGGRAGDIIPLDADNSMVLGYNRETELGAMGPVGLPGAMMKSARPLASSPRGELPGLSYQDAKDGGRGQAVGGPLVTATVRSLFADTAFWQPSVITDGDGMAKVEFAFPDNITKWQVTARGITASVEVGTAEAQTVTKKNLLVRLQSPRFFVDHDKVTLSANVHNYLDSDKTARVELVTEGDRIAVGEGASNAAVRTLTIAKDGELRVDWTVDVRKAGRTKIKVVAQTDQESDAAELEFPVLVHGVEKFVAQSGILHNGGNASVTLDIPEMRRRGASLLDVQLSPSLASVLLDALPYLEDYPYGCVEQTTSRFVPTVLVAKTLRDSGIDLETIGKRAAALEEQRKNIPPQQVYADSGYTYPKGAPGVLDTKELASRLAAGYHGRSGAPIFDSKSLGSMVAAGLQRLKSMQRGDGSWGWWEGSTVGDVYLTAYVVESLNNARAAKSLGEDPQHAYEDMIVRGNKYLKDHLDSTEELDLLAYYVYVITTQNDTASWNSDQRLLTTADKLYERRERLTPYGQALLARGLHNIGIALNEPNAGQKAGSNLERARVLVRNLANSAKRDKERGTVHWEPADTRYYWRWYNDKQETTAAVLRALVAIAPQEQLAPVNGAQSEQTGLAPLAVRWLVDNRRSGHWDSTKQTAQVVLALLEYATAQKELMPDYTVTLDVDGKVQKSYRITKENALFFDNRFLVGDEILASGGQKLNIRMEGTGTLYFSSYLKYFDMSEPIKAVSNAIGVERKYYKIVSTAKPSKRTGAKGETDTTSERVPLMDGASLVSGDIVEVELYLKSDNDYDHLVFEDMKPAGCEAVETRSGTAYGDGICSNFELRDEKVVFFVDRLPQGTTRIMYKLRAEIPGTFHALPTNAYAMYAPDIRALSDEWRVTITDAPTAVTKLKAEKKK